MVNQLTDEQYLELTELINPIPVTKETAVEGKIANNSAAYYNGSANYKNSTYYPILNFYDGEVSKTLKILPKFKTYQQTSATSCGDAAALMALRYFGIENVNEYDLYTYDYSTGQQIDK